MKVVFSSARATGGTPVGPTGETPVLRGADAPPYLRDILAQLTGYVASLSVSFEYNSRPQWKPLAHHPEAALHAAYAKDLCAEPFGYLSNELGNYYHQMADFVRAETHLRRAHDARNHPGQNETVGFAATCGNLGSVLSDRGEYEQAERYQRRALEIREKALGPEHPHTLGSVNNLAFLRYDQKCLPEAIALMRRVVEGREKVLGPSHPDTIASKETLATMLQK